MDHAPVRPPRRRGRRVRLIVAAVLVAICLALAGAMLLEARSLRVTRVAFASADLPRGFDGLRVAFVSDVHYGSFVSRARVRETVDRVNALHPDLIILGGDYIYRKTSGSDIRLVFAELSRLRAPLGVYGVLGNHDLALLEVNVAPVMKAAGIHELYDSGVWLRRGGDRLRLAGLSGVLDSTLPPPAVGHATPEDFVLLASHSPDVTESLGGTPVDLVLAGHTHGGQITVFGLWSPLIPSRYGNKYRVGMVTSGPVPVYVTTGVGTIVVPLRFFARPEVVLLTLRRT